MVGLTTFCILQLMLYEVRFVFLLCSVSMVKGINNMIVVISIMNYIKFNLVMAPIWIKFHFEYNINYYEIKIECYIFTKPMLKLYTVLKLQHLQLVCQMKFHVAVIYLIPCGCNKDRLSSNNTSENCFVCVCV